MNEEHEIIQLKWKEHCKYSIIIYYVKMIKKLNEKFKILSCVVIFFIQYVCPCQSPCHSVTSDSDMGLYFSN